MYAITPGWLGYSSFEGLLVGYLDKRQFGKFQKLGRVWRENGAPIVEGAGGVATLTAARGRRQRPWHPPVGRRTHTASWGQASVTILSLNRINLDASGFSSSPSGSVWPSRRHAKCARTARRGAFIGNVFMARAFQE
jgi:hypothetical protein